MNKKSLSNLNPYANFKGGKQPIKLSLLPETIAWLKRSGNASQRVEDLVKAAKEGRLKPSRDG